MFSWSTLELQLRGYQFNFTKTICEQRCQTCISEISLIENKLNCFSYGRQWKKGHQEITIKFHLREYMLNEIKENLWLFLNSIFKSAAIKRPRLSKHTVCIWSPYHLSGYITCEKIYADDKKHKLKERRKENLCFCWNFTKIICYCKASMDSGLHMKQWY